MTTREVGERLALTDHGVYMCAARGQLHRVIRRPYVGFDPLEVERFRQARETWPAPPELAWHRND